MTTNLFILTKFWSNYSNEGKINGEKKKLRIGFHGNSKKLLLEFQGESYFVSAGFKVFSVNKGGEGEGYS